MDDSIKTGPLVVNEILGKWAKAEPQHIVRTGNMVYAVGPEKSPIDLTAKPVRYPAWAGDLWRAVVIAVEALADHWSMPNKGIGSGYQAKIVLQGQEFWGVSSFFPSAALLQAHLRLLDSSRDKDDADRVDVAEPVQHDVSNHLVSVYDEPVSRQEPSGGALRNMEIRGELIGSLNKAVESLTGTQAAKKLGTSGARISDLRNERVDNFTVDALVNMAIKAGMKIIVTVDGNEHFYSDD